MVIVIAFATGRVSESFYHLTDCYICDYSDKGWHSVLYFRKSSDKNPYLQRWLAKAIGINNIGKLSFIICALAITLAFIHTYIEYIIIENEKKASNN